MIENIVFTLANISNDQEYHEQLIQNGLLKVIQKYVKIYIEKKSEGIDIKMLSTKSLNLIKAICAIMTNLG